MKAVKPIHSFFLLFSTLAGSFAQADSCIAFYAGFERPGFFYQERIQTPVREEFEPDWRNFEKALLKFKDSEKKFKNFQQLIVSLNRYAGPYYNVEFEYRSKKGRLKTFRGTKPELIVETEGGKKVMSIAYSDFQRIQIEDINIKKVRIERIEIDPRDTKIPVSDFAKQVGYTSLNHFIRQGDKLEILFNILKSGQLGIRGISYGDPNYEPNYFSLFRKNWEIKNEFYDYSIEYDIRLLDQNDYFVNRIWDFGKYTNDSIRFDETERLKRFLINHFHSTGEEVVKYQTVPNMWIKTIYVPENDRASLLRMLKKARIKPPDKRPWEKIIKGQ